MCGICGLVCFSNEKSPHIESMISRLRHRGYDSYGICSAASTNEPFNIQKSTQPPITDDLNHSDTVKFQIGHTRYTTRGSHESLEQAQPLLSASTKVALVHNGQIKCDPEIYGSDSMRLLDLLEQKFQEQHITVDQAMQKLFTELSGSSGSYACIALIKTVGMIAFRDTRGIRPLVMGFSSKTGNIGFGSESCAIDESFDTILDILPGQYVWINNEGGLTFGKSNSKLQLCLFEYIYLAHDDSVIDGMSVRDVRKTLGRALLPQINAFCKTYPIDMLVPIPHTPVLAGKEITAAMPDIEFMELLSVTSRTTRRESRTFILPTSDARETAVRQKFAIKPELISKCRGKNILLLDDSIVRGTTLKHVVQLLRDEVKPSKIYVASLAPPIVAPNCYGIDIPNVKELIAYPEPHEVSFKLGLDGPVIYQKLENIENVLGRNFEDSVFRPLSRQKTIYEILGEQI